MKSPKANNSTAMIVRTPTPNPWLTQLRAAALAEITPEDVQQIVRGIIDRAKGGDRFALQVVFGCILADGPTANLSPAGNKVLVAAVGGQPTEALPGTREKLAKMSDRVLRGQPLFNERDACAESGDMRR